MVAMVGVLFSVDFGRGQHRLEGRRWCSARANRAGAVVVSDTGASGSNLLDVLSAYTGSGRIDVHHWMAVV